MIEQFHRPKTVREALALKTRYRNRAAFLAGGTLSQFERIRGTTRTLHQPGGLCPWTASRSRRAGSRSEPSVRSSRSSMSAELPEATQGRGAPDREPQRAQHGHDRRARRAQPFLQRPLADAGGARCEGGRCRPRRDQARAGRGLHRQADSGAHHRDRRAQAGASAGVRLPKRPCLRQRAFGGHGGGVAVARRQGRHAADHRRGRGLETRRAAVRGGEGIGRPSASDKRGGAGPGEPLLARDGSREDRSAGSVALIKHEAGAVVALALEAAGRGKRGGR